jgi:hypothetical protein
LNDFLVGSICASYLALHSNTLERLVSIFFQVMNRFNSFQKDQNDFFKRLLTELTLYPAGLKLNSNLATFLSDMFFWTLDSWQGMNDGIYTKSII